MSETNKSEGTPEQEMTPQEYHKLRIEAQKELKKEISFLKTEAEYQRLEAEIEESKARRLKAIAIQYQLQNPQAAAQPGQHVPGKPPANEVYDHPMPGKTPFAPKDEKKERKLKVEK